MEGTKNLLASRTFWGALLGFASSALSCFGIDFGDEEQAKLAYILADAGAFALIIWGRIAASKAIKLPEIKKTTPICLLLLLCLILPACAVKELKPHEQAMVVTNECITLYHTLHKEYLRLYTTLPERREVLEADAAPVLDAAKITLITMGDTVTLWALTQVKPIDWDSVKERATNLLADAGAILARIKGVRQ